MSGFSYKILKYMYYNGQYERKIQSNNMKLAFVFLLCGFFFCPSFPCINAKPMCECILSSFLTANTDLSCLFF